MIAAVPLRLLATWCLAEAAIAVEVAPASIEAALVQEGDECHGAEQSGEQCALNALQLRASMSAAGSVLEVAALEIGGSPPLELVESGSCNGMAYNIATQGCCGGSTVYSYDTQGCCGGKAVYDSATEGCCNEHEVFSLSVSGACSPSPGPAAAPGADRTGIYLRSPPRGPALAEGENGSAGSVAGAAPQFACKSQWPIATARAAWSAYCDTKGHKAWAMNENCTFAWYKVGANSTEEAVEAAKDNCTENGNATCATFDFDGSVCAENPKARYCNGVEYDTSKQGCCGGSVYRFRTQDCCGGVHVFKRKTHDCCAGTVPYPKRKYGCCGEKYLYRKKTQACCLEDERVQVYKLGKQNCCSMSGVCTVQYDEWSCCN